MSSVTAQATSYHKGSKPQLDVGIIMIDMLNVEKGATVLDLGCGTGYLTKVLTERVGPKGKVVADPDGEQERTTQPVILNTSKLMTRHFHQDSTTLYLPTK